MKDFLLNPNQVEVLAKVALMFAGIIYLYFTNKQQENASNK